MVIRELYNIVRKKLRCAGIENDAFESSQIFESAGVNKTLLIAEPARELSENISSEILNKTERRLSGEPLQYILGEWEFYGLPFKVGKGVLIPRQDTETLVDTAARFLKKRETKRTLDLCAGSGCIGISLAVLADAKVTCIEKSESAFFYLKENIALNNVSVKAVLGDVFDDTENGDFDLVVSNPPYLSNADMNALQKEVKFEPKTALHGGVDGLDFYRKMIEIYPRKLKSGGMIAFEIGLGQDLPVCELFRERGLDPRVEKDLCGINRVVYAIVK